MKKLLFLALFIFSIGALTSCNKEQDTQDITIKQLIGTWDLVSIETYYTDGTIKKTNGDGDYFVISEDIITYFYKDTEGINDNGKPWTFSFISPHFMIGGFNTYDLVSLKNKTLTLKRVLILSSDIEKELFTYNKR